MEKNQGGIATQICEGAIGSAPQDPDRLRDYMDGRSVNTELEGALDFELVITREVENAMSTGNRR